MMDLGLDVMDDGLLPPADLRPCGDIKALVAISLCTQQNSSVQKLGLEKKDVISANYVYDVLYGMVLRIEIPSDHPDDVDRLKNEILASTLRIQFAGYEWQLSLLENAQMMHSHGFLSFDPNEEPEDVRPPLDIDEFVTTTERVVTSSLPELDPDCDTLDIPLLPELLFGTRGIPMNLMTFQSLLVSFHWHATVCAAVKKDKLRLYSGVHQQWMFGTAERETFRDVVVKPKHSFQVSNFRNWVLAGLRPETVIAAQPPIKDIHTLLISCRASIPPRLISIEDFEGGPLDLSFAHHFVQGDMSIYVFNFAEYGEALPSLTILKAVFEASDDAIAVSVLASVEKKMVFAELFSLTD